MTAETGSKNVDERRVAQTKREKLTWDVIRVIFILNEGEAIEANHLICYSASTELIADGLGHHHDDLRGDNRSI